MYMSMSFLHLVFVIGPWDMGSRDDVGQSEQRIIPDSRFRGGLVSFQVASG